jgi:hypothetical protein
VGLPLTPGYVLRGIVIGLSKSARIKKSEQRYLGEHVVSRARFKPFSNLCVWIACQSRDDAVFPAPVFTNSQTTGAVTCARLRASCCSAPDPGVLLN